MTDKSHHFLLIVQTMFLANAVNKRADDLEGENRHKYSASAAFMAMDEAIFASTRIPQEMSAAEAANEFASYILGEKGSKLSHWFARN